MTRAPRASFLGGQISGTPDELHVARTIGLKMAGPSPVGHRLDPEHPDGRPAPEQTAFVSAFAAVGSVVHASGSVMGWLRTTGLDARLTLWEPALRAMSR